MTCSVKGNPLLGICIPVYKRPDQLRLCLQSAIEAAKTYDVPIFVADDATDGTNDAIVSQAQSHYPYITHVRNPVNLGIDRNILHAVDICTCLYAWLLGEDDRLCPHAISQVMDVLERNNPRFLYVNYSSIDETGRIILKDKSLSLLQDCTMKASEFLACDAWSMGFLGACVVHTESWRTINPDPYIGTYFAHVGRIMAYLKGDVLHMMAEPLVLNRCGSPNTFTWTGSTFDVVTGWRRLTKALEPLYGAKVCRESFQSFERTHGVGTLYFLAYLRADEAFDHDVFKRFISPSSRSQGYKIGAWVISRMPSKIFRGSRFFLNQYRAVRYGRP